MLIRDKKTTHAARGSTRGRRPRLASNVWVGSPGLDVAGLRSLARAEPQEFMQRAHDLIEAGELSWSKVRHLGNLFDALADVPVEANVEWINGRTRAITTAAFPLLSGALTVAGLNEAYEAVPTVGEQLVTDMEDPKKLTHVVGILTESHNKDRVDEGDPFPLVGSSEEFYTIGHKRNGLRIQITAEMIEENDVAGVTDRVNALGEIPGEVIEELTLSRVCDVHGSGNNPAEPFVLRRNGTAAPLYRAGAKRPGPRAPEGTRITQNALETTENLERARRRLTTMRNSRKRRISIPVNRMQLVAPDARSGVASKILNSEYEPGVLNEVNDWGPNGRYRPQLVSTPLLDDMSPDTWYLGDFKRQYRRKHKLRMELVTLSGDMTTSFLRSRVAFEARVAWDVEVGAVDYVYVVQCLKGTTPPTPPSL